MSEGGSEQPGPELIGSQGEAHQDLKPPEVSKPERSFALKLRGGIGSVLNTFNPHAKELKKDEEISLEKVAEAVSLVTGQHTRRDSTNQFPYRSVAAELGLSFDPNDPRSEKVRRKLYQLKDMGALTVDVKLDDEGNTVQSYSVTKENTEALKKILSTK
jgi:hypothetical protein